MMPPKSVLSKEFHYVNSANTNLSRTFARIRRELKEREEKAAPKVEQIRKVKR